MKAIDYHGKTVVVTGAATGIGNEVVRSLLGLGATVHALVHVHDIHIKPAVGTGASLVKIDLGEVQVDLGDKASIDAAVAHLPESIHSVFACAGVSGKDMTPLRVATTNFIGHRHLIESLIPRMPSGSSIGMIASIGGMGWIANIPAILPFLQTKSFEEAVAYLEARQEDPAILGGPPEANRGYTFSKEAMILYAKFRSWSLAAQKIRINTVSPGATETHMLQEFGVSPDAGAKNVSPIGVPSTPRYQANALIYLNSEAAEYISGADLVADYGFSGGIYTGQGATTVE